MADFFAEATSSEFTSFASNMFAPEKVFWVSMKRSLNSCHARSASVLTAHKRTRQRGSAQHFLSMDSVVNERPVVVLDDAQVVSRNPQLLQPDLDVEPAEIVLLHLQRRIVFEEDKPSCVLHVRSTFALGRRCDNVRQDIDLEGLQQTLLEECVAYPTGSISML